MDWNILEDGGMVTSESGPEAGEIASNPATNGAVAICKTFLSPCAILNGFCLETARKFRIDDGDCLGSSRRIGLDSDPGVSPAETF